MYYLDPLVLGVHNKILTATTTTTYITFSEDNSTTTVDDVSVKEILGDWELTLGTGGGSIITENEELKFTQGAISEAIYASQGFPTTIGDKYQFSADLLSVSTPQLWKLQINIGNQKNSSSIKFANGREGWIVGQKIISTFKATSSTTYISILDSQKSSKNSTWDNVSVRKIMDETSETTVGSILGFVRLEADELKKCGVVTGLTNNTITIDTVINLPLLQDYIMFVKNQVINTSSLLGYYADVKLENNSKKKAELFSMGSEITESSK